MSGVAVIQYLLANNAPLTAVVTAAKIKAGPIPINTALPAISVVHVSGVPRNIVGMNAASYMATDRVQVTVMAATYPLQKSIMALIRAACPNTRGTVNGVNCDSVLPDVEGPDFRDETAEIYMGSQDYFVKFNR